MEESSIKSMQRSRAKGPEYQGIFYEFYEMWLIAMYLELGSLYFTGTDSFGAGCTWNTPPDASNWISGGSSGIRIKDEKGDGTDYYGGLVRTVFETSEDSYIEPLDGLLGSWNEQNFEEALESQRFVDALVKSNLADKVDGVTVLEYDDNKNGYVKVSDGVDVASGSGMTEGKKYYVIRNVPNCQGIGDGVMTYVLNVFVKTTFNNGVARKTFNVNGLPNGSVDVGGKTVIFKFSYPTYRGLELLSGAQTHIEGINYVVGNYEGVSKGSIWYAKDYTSIKYDPTNYKPTDSKVPIDEDIPYIKGFVKGGEFDNSDFGWVKNANYDVSLYYATECSKEEANKFHYECGYVSRSFSPSDGNKRVSSSVVGCNSDGGGFGRTLYANNSVGYGSADYAGRFSIGNPSLHPTHGNDSGTTIA